MQPADRTQPSEADEAIDVDEIVRETLADITPRAAALALLRFPDYLELIQQAGVPTTDDLCAALFVELRQVCVRDRWLEPATVDGR